MLHFPMGRTFPPFAMYAASLLLLGFHSLYSFPSTTGVLSPYTRCPGAADMV